MCVPGQSSLCLLGERIHAACFKKLFDAGPCRSTRSVVSQSIGRQEHAKLKSCGHSRARRGRRGGRSRHSLQHEEHPQDRSTHQLPHPQCLLIIQAPLAELGLRDNVGIGNHGATAVGQAIKAQGKGSFLRRCGRLQKGSHCNSAL